MRIYLKIFFGTLNYSERSIYRFAKDDYCTTHIASIVHGICSLPASGQLGDIGLKTLIYYFSTTAIAVTIGLIAVFIISPGTKESSLKIRENRSNEINQIRAEHES